MLLGCLWILTQVPFLGELNYPHGFKVGLYLSLALYLYPNSKPTPFPPYSQLAPTHIPGFLIALSPTSTLNDSDLDDRKVDSHVLQDTDIPNQGPRRQA